MTVAVASARSDARNRPAAPTDELVERAHDRGETEPVGVPEHRDDQATAAHRHRYSEVDVVGGPVRAVEVVPVEPGNVTQCAGCCVQERRGREDPVRRRMVLVPIAERGEREVEVDRQREVILRDVAVGARHHLADPLAHRDGSISRLRRPLVDSCRQRGTAHIAGDDRAGRAGPREGRAGPGHGLLPDVERTEMRAPWAPVGA